VEKVQGGVLPLNYSRSTSLDYHSALGMTTVSAHFSGPHSLGLPFSFALRKIPAQEPEPNSST
jgi:hypothetical protein